MSDERQNDSHLVNPIFVDGGLIGLTIKDRAGATSFLGAEISINTSAHIEDVCSEIEKHIVEKIQQGMRINDWQDYYAETVDAQDEKRVCWFADDYIPSVFELKFIEQQLDYNPLLSFVFVPRDGYYANDISYNDVHKILSYPQFSRLKQYSIKGRFVVSEHGMDLGAFNGNRITRGLLKEMDESDTIVISGARSFEMAQGLNKNVYFTGIAVCRRYTEALTGISMNSGEGVFLHASPCVPCFVNFQYRHAGYPFAEVTVLQYYSRKNRIE